MRAGYQKATGKTLAENEVIINALVAEREGNGTPEMQKSVTKLINDVAAANSIYENIFITSAAAEFGYVDIHDGATLHPATEQTYLDLANETDLIAKASIATTSGKAVYIVAYAIKNNSGIFLGELCMENTLIILSVVMAVILGVFTYFLIKFFRIISKEISDAFNVLMGGLGDAIHSARRYFRHR